MSKVVIRTDTADGFFERAKDAARKADQAQAFDDKVTKGLSLMGKSNLENGFSAAQTLTRSIS